ncbi:MAG: CDP-alcohol phosphatidyltransferase family protein [Crocinitomix sp.]|nr:CDP-alcohol phosphatidyltransferase family protein [Crocinitomix sp.]
MKEKIINLPNFLSLYRLLTFPFLVWMILTEKANLFAIFLCINLITDILDGLIARVFKLETKFGAKLDSLADIGTYICAFWGIFTFKQAELEESIHLLWPFLVLFILGQMISIVKFRQAPSLHLYASKIGGYVQGIYFFILFAWFHVPWLYFMAIGVGYLSWLEEIIVLLVLNEPRSNVKGIYWVLKERSSRKN